ncbi:alginate export family protein [Nitrospina watsonii]|uniref:Alginate_exp domain-containing protein n=1 Tax=Nitrospina watsonii TaxID=1323948 RepID=A0ABN8W5B6_9BACT|nr:alginate export family protein [Nitrospina watsonii]CAI2718841.1 Alginate_exp domain-containing protein [Nitrospina watsonii]
MRQSICIYLILAAVFLTGTPLWVSAKADRPSYNQSRYEEDYSFLRDASRRTDYLDSLKFIPADERGEIYFSIGGETRQHFEYIDNENWGARSQDDNGWYLQRYLLHTDFHVRDRFRLFFQLQTGTESGRAGGPRGVDEDRMDVNQLFADFKISGGGSSDFTLRFGRQEIVFGARRFFNYRERPNLRLSHDAAMLTWQDAATTVTGFVARPVQISRDFFDNNSGNEQSWWGLYGVHKTGWSVFPNFDLYYVGLNHEAHAFDQGVANETRHTLGTRLWGEEGALDYDVEFVYQFGTFGDSQIRAWAVASDTGYTVPLAGERSARLSVRADVYSGDNNRNDGDLNAFNPMFPKGKHISQSAPVGLINTYQLQPRITLKWDRHWSATASAMFVWRESLNDGVYSIGNGLLRTGQQNRSRYVGTQQEVEVKYQFDRHLDIKAIYNYFESGSFIEQGPFGKDIVYWSGMLTYRF